MDAQTIGVILGAAVGTAFGTFALTILNYVRSARNTKKLDNLDAKVDANQKETLSVAVPIALEAQTTTRRIDDLEKLTANQALSLAALENDNMRLTEQLDAQRQRANEQDRLAVERAAGYNKKISELEREVVSLKEKVTTSEQNAQNATDALASERTRNQQLTRELETLHRDISEMKRRMTELEIEKRIYQEKDLIVQKLLDKIQIVATAITPAATQELPITDPSPTVATVTTDDKPTDPPTEPNAAAA